MLERIELPARLDERPIHPCVLSMIHDLHQRIEAFQDRWDVPQIEQFVAADYALVYQTLAWIRETQLLPGNRFLEWGCGFAAVTAIADGLGWDAIGIEAEPTLISHGRKTIQQWCQPLRTGLGESALARDVTGPFPDLVEGNFLPSDAEMLADDPTLPSLGHEMASAYDMIGLDLDDFAIVYSYPWPGEDEFHESVFERFAGQGAVLVQFTGPNEMRAWRSTRNRRS